MTGGGRNPALVARLAEGELELDQIYILSLPSFAWFKATYQPIQSRTHHTCHPVGAGNRQMLVIGGQSFSQTTVPGYAMQQDAFAQGLGIFDLSDLEWKSSYDANADTYRTPQMIKDYISVS